MINFLGPLLGPEWARKAGAAFWGGFLGVMGPSVVGAWAQGTERLVDVTTYSDPLGMAMSAGLGALLMAFGFANKRNGQNVDRGNL